MNMRIIYEWLEFKGFNPIGNIGVINNIKNTDSNIIIMERQRLVKGVSRFDFIIMIVILDDGSLGLSGSLYKEDRFISGLTTKEFDDICDWYASEMNWVMK